MSDELDFAKGGGVGAAVMAFVGVLWAAFVRRGEKNADKVEADLEARLTHLEKAKESHREQLEELKRVAVELDTRLKFREGAYGLEPLTTPGARPSPSLEAFRRAAKETDE